MTQEEKAKAYDEAIEKAKDYYHLGDDKHKMAIDAKAVMEYIFPELKESEDEKIRKALIDFFKAPHAYEDFKGIPFERVVAWLEKQGGHAKFINGIQVGDKVTRNQDGVLVNLSQLNRVAKKQGEQKPTWKPSDEQMNALNYVVNLMASSERPTENDLYYNILKSLRQQLKKLKE